MGFKVLENLAYCSGTVVDEAGVYLNQGGTGVQHLLGLLRGHDASDTDDGQDASGLLMDVAHHRQALLIQGLAAQAAVAYGLDLLGVGGEPFTGIGCVCGDYTVEAGTQGQVHDAVHMLVRDVGRYLEQDGAVVVVIPSEGEQMVHYLRQVAYVLQDSEVLDVGAGYVHCEIVHVVVEQGEGTLVILVGILIRSLGGLGYVAADDDIRDALLELGHGVFYTFIIDAHAVDEGVVFYESERAGLGIARLRLGGEGAYLHETEAEVAHVVVELSVLVQTCRQAHGIPECQAEYFAAQLSLLVPDTENSPYKTLGKWNIAQELQEAESDVMGRFRREGEEYTSDEQSVHSVSALIRRQRYAKNYLGG